MKAISFLVVASILISSQAHALAPEQKQHGCVAGCANAGAGGGGGGSGNATPTKANLTSVTLVQTVFSAPGNIVLSAKLQADFNSQASCSFKTSVVNLDGALPVAVSNTSLSGKIPGPLTLNTNLQPGKYRIEFAVENQAISACKGIASTTFEVKRQQMSFAPAGPKITNIALDSDSILTHQKLGVTIAGEGKECNYYLTIFNKDTLQEWPVPKVSTFPTTQKLSIDMSDAQYTHGNYKITAKARANDVRPGVSCEGGGNYLAFKKTRGSNSLTTGDVPQIVDILIGASKKMDGSNRYRSDETIKFNVVGSVDNTDDPSKRCGWTLHIVDKNGAITTIGKNNQFGEWQTSSALTNLATGSYDLIARTTSADDGLAKLSCLGKATKKVEVFHVPGVISALNFKTFTPLDLTIFESETARLEIFPQINGPTCAYKVTRKINHGKTIVTNHMHIEGVADKLPQEDYPDEETLVDLTIEGAFSTNYYEGGSCEGKIKRSLTLYDDKKPVVHY